MCEGRLGWARLPGRETRWGVGRGKRGKMSDKRPRGRGEGEEERRSIAEREGGKARRLHGLPGDAGQRRREAGARRAAGAGRAGSARHQISLLPALPSPGPSRPDITCGTEGGSWGWEGWSGAGTKELRAPHRAAHLAPGTRHLLPAHRWPFGPGPGTWRDVRIVPGEKMTASQPRQ